MAQKVQLGAFGFASYIKRSKRDKIESAFKRGGNWNNTSNAGVFTLNLNNAPSHVNTNIGFRCARFSGHYKLEFLSATAIEREQINPRFYSFSIHILKEKILSLYPKKVRVANLILLDWVLKPNLTESNLRNFFLGSLGFSIMKTNNNLFEKICSFENLHLAFRKAVRGKRFRKEMLEFKYNLEENLLCLRDELLTRKYQPGGYREFTVNDSKKRQIKAAPFRDRVVHHAVCNIIEPIFDQGFIFDSYACRKEKGTHKAVRRLEQFLQSANAWIREREREREEIARPVLPAMRYFQILCQH